jgi:hypothetical protein
LWAWERPDHFWVIALPGCRRSQRYSMASLPGDCADALLSANTRLCGDRPTRYGRTNSVAHGQQVLAYQHCAEDLPDCRDRGSYLVCRNSSFHSSSRSPDYCLLGGGAPTFRLSVPQEEIAHRPLQQWIDRKFFREAFDSEVMLSQLAKTAQTISDPAALIRTVSHRISDVLHVDRLTVLLRSNCSFEPAYSIGPALAASVRALDQARTSAPMLKPKGLSHGAVHQCSRESMGVWFRALRADR